MDIETVNLIDSNKIQISEKFYELLHFIQDLASRRINRVEFLQKLTEHLFNTLNCSVIEIWIKENNHFSHCQMSHDANSFLYDVISIDLNNIKDIKRVNDEKKALNYLQMIVLNGNYKCSQNFRTDYGSLWIDDTQNSLRSIISNFTETDCKKIKFSNKKSSIAIIPLKIGSEIIGLIQLTSSALNYFNNNTIGVYESVAQLVGTSITAHQTQDALRERVKELACLYEIVQIAGRTGITKNEILHSIVKLLPKAWQYPDITIGRIEYEGKIYSTSKFHKGWQKQTAEIIVKNSKRGTIEVIYTEVKPRLDEGPFLREERHLIDAIAKQVALILEKKDAEEEKYVIKEQLRHADRLATIGQLASGVAHELNEPLTGILGYSQLIGKYDDLPDGARKDIDKIIKSTLHARDVIKKLLLFAREIKPETQKINLNKLIEEGLFFFEARCANAGIELSLDLSPNIPEFDGERSQLNQVLINLVVNSMQAMPEGGRLLIGTDVKNEEIILIVKDNGIGMTDEVKKKCFLPFFTTKDINEGTGLGLAVVHGIVKLHNGSIHIESTSGQGTCFEVRFSKKSIL